MIGFLRATLSGSREPVTTLAAEVAMLSDYLELMRMRLGPRLAYTIDLPTALHDRPLPALLLQPLVENAVLHGIEPSLEGGRIDVTAVLAPTGALELSVTDTGVGQDADTVRHAAGGAGFGLAQLRERLARTYGERASVAVTSPPQGLARGTRVLIRIDGEAANMGEAA
jgi:sensor histidine kinase YesM